MTEEQKIHIRPMEQKDLAAVAALEAQIFTEAWSLPLWEETLCATCMTVRFWNPISLRTDGNRRES